ncbi:unnamed protein product [Cunninghamella blakesleeana]
MSNIKHLVAFTNIKERVQSLLPISLPCPRTGKLSTFLYHEPTLQLYEISKVTQGRKSCWLVEDTIYIDGAIHFISRVDPLFIALYLLEQQNAKEQQFRTVDDLFEESDFHRIVNNTLSKQLFHLCDTQKIAQDMYVYRFNQEKSLQWLKQKVDLFLSHLENTPVFKSELNDIEEDKKKEYCIRESIYVFAKYLTINWIDKLFESYEIKQEDPIVESMALVENQPSVDDYFKLVGKAKVDDTMETPAKKIKPAVPRSLAKVNTKGMAPLTSFFKAKKN